MAKDKNQKAFKDQYDDEEVLMVFPLGVLIISYVKPDSLPNETQYLLILLLSFLVGVILMFPSWIYWYFSVYIVTDKRFIQIVQKGLFTKSFSDIGIHHVQSVNYQVVGLQETLLGFGTIVVQTYLGDMVINNVHHPAAVTKEMSMVLREHGTSLGQNDTDEEPVEQEELEQ
jgi:uncharacterized membrane protein YdbT with pleckstrin-like domain